MIRLNYPVHDLSGRLLLPSGAPLSRDVLGELASWAGAPRSRPVPILSFDTVSRDLVACTRRDPYRTIFGDLRRDRALRSLMESVRLPPEVLAALCGFRRKDPYTYRHILTVFALLCLLVSRMEAGEAREFFPEVSSGPLHDFGKVLIPLPLLRKDRPLRRRERLHLEHHAPAGAVLLGFYLGDFGSLASRVARDHHERRDGSGYPRGLRLVDRSVEIVAACDVYDALISPRPYRKTPYDNRTALEEITRMAEAGSVGWDVVRLLVSQNRRGKPSYREVKVSVEKRGTPPEGNLYGLLVEEEEPVPA